MKIVIDLDEKYYNDIKNSPTASNYSTLYALFGIRNGRPLQAELEEIKAEISDYAVVDDSKSIKRGFEIMQGIVLELLDNHISELKGE